MNMRMAILGIAASTCVVILNGALASTPSFNEIIKRPGEPIGKFRNTYYYSVLESEYENDPIDNALYTLDDTVLVKVSSTFKKAVDIEGTGKLLDGRVVNYAGRKDGTTRYHVTIHPYGHGVGDCALIPFYTVAVDPTKIPLGSLVYIDETLGMKLPDGTSHDGYWHAEDIGGAIKQDRIDLFVGEGNQGAVLRRHGIKNMKALHVRLVSLPAEDSCVKKTSPR